MTDKNTPVPELPLTRGCMVTYEGTGHTTVYYFQPNGNSCYLYENKEDVGDKQKAVFTPGIYSVRTIDPAVGLRWLEERREHQAKLKHVQQLLLHQGLVRSKTNGLVYTTKGQEQQASSPHFHCVNLLEPMEHEMSDLEILTEETAPEHHRAFAQRQARFEKKALVHYKAGQVVWYRGEPWFFGVYLKYSPRATLYRESKGKEEVTTVTVLLGDVTSHVPKKDQVLDEDFDNAVLLYEDLHVEDLHVDPVTSSSQKK